MDFRLVIGSLLLLGLPVTAQVKPDQPPAKPDAAAAAAPAAQDPDRPAPKPVDPLSDLTREKERLQREIDYAKNSVMNAKAMLTAKLGKRGQTYKAIDAGTSATEAPAVAQAIRKARIMLASELEKQPEDTMLVVNGHAVRRAEFDQLMNYLRSTPSSGDDNVRAQRVMFDLVRTYAVVAAFPENEAEGQIGDVLGQLQTGKSMVDVAKSIGSVQGADAEGSIEVTRNSFLGTKLEQVAFTLQPGTLSRPTPTTQGLVIVKVDSLVKGDSPELDKVKAHMVLAPWRADPATLQKVQVAASSGQAEILVRDQAVLDMLPAMWRATAAAIPQDPTAEQFATLQGVLVQIDETLTKLKAQQGPDVKAQIEQLQAQRVQVQKAIEELKVPMDADVGRPKDAAPVVAPLPRVEAKVEKKAEAKK